MKLQYDKLLSTFASKFKLRRYTKDMARQSVASSPRGRRRSSSGSVNSVMAGPVMESMFRQPKFDDLEDEEPALPAAAAAGGKEGRSGGGGGRGEGGGGRGVGGGPPTPAKRPGSLVVGGGKEMTIRVPGPIGMAVWLHVLLEAPVLLAFVVRENTPPFHTVGRCRLSL